MNMPINSNPQTTEAAEAWSNLTNNPQRQLSETILSILEGNGNVNMPQSQARSGATFELKGEDGKEYNVIVTNEPLTTENGVKNDYGVKVQTNGSTININNEELIQSIVSGLQDHEEFGDKIPDFEAEEDSGDTLGTADERQRQGLNSMGPFEGNKAEWIKLGVTKAEPDGEVTTKEINSEPLTQEELDSLPSEIKDFLDIEETSTTSDTKEDIQTQAKESLQQLLEQNPELEDISRNYTNENGEVFSILNSEDGYVAYYADEPNGELQRVDEEGFLNVMRGGGQVFVSDDGSINFVDTKEEDPSLNGSPITRFDLE